MIVWAEQPLGKEEYKFSFYFSTTLDIQWKNPSYEDKQQPFSWRSTFRAPYGAS